MKIVLNVLLAVYVSMGLLLAKAAAQTASESSDTIPVIPFAQLSDQNMTVDGRRALAIRPTEWKHTETPHFVIHFFRTFIAAPVSVEAEFYYRYITTDLDVHDDGRVAGVAGKTHIYLFENRQDWLAFRQVAMLESWTGAVCIDGALFVPRYPEFKWKGNALGHEIAHLMVHLYFGRRLPLWMSEGYAEDVSNRGIATFYRARGYRSAPRELSLPSWMPLAQLTSLGAYPPEGEVETFYRESRALTAFLGRDGKKPQFLKLFKAMAQGTPFPTALSDAYGSRWSSLDMLEAEFRKEMEKKIQD